MTAAEPLPAELSAAIQSLEPYFTPPENFRDVSRGKPMPHSLPEEKKREVGLHRETWKLEVISDPENPATLGKQLTKKDGTALDFDGAAEARREARGAVREGDDLPEHRLPAGHGHLGRRAAARGRLADAAEGEPAPRLLLRLPQRRPEADVPQLAAGRPRAGRPDDLPPVILCYKLNGEWLDAERGGPVRIVVPEAYGFKSVKWLTHIVLTQPGPRQRHLRRAATTTSTAR